MKKFITAVFAAVLALGLQIPCLAADLSPATGEVIVYVIIALAVAAAAIIGTLIYTKMKK